MRALAISLLAASLPAAVAGQQGPTLAAAPAMKTFSSSADVTALIAKAKSERKEGQPIVSEPILQLASYNANLEYRASVGNAAVREREAEVSYVIDGSATMVTGGKLVKESRTNATNIRL